MIHQAKIGEDAYANCLKSPLVTQGETIAIDLLPQKQKTKSKMDQEK